MTRLLICLLWLLVLPSGAQTPEGTLSIPGRFDRFTTDELGNIYALRGDEIEMFDRRGRGWLRNSVKTFGRVTTIDPFYSLKPMVFSAEQGQLATLDNTLSVQGSVINLPRRGFPQVVLACVSVQNAFWFFDQRELELVRVDAQLRPLASTGRIDQLLGIAPDPVQMQELDNWLFVNSPKHGILVFDLFAGYYKTIPITDATSFEVRKEALYFMREGRPQRYDMKRFDTVELPLPALPADAVIRDARVEQERLYLLLDDQILITPVGER